MLQQLGCIMLTNKQITALRQYVVPLIPKNKKGFSSTHDPIDILRCIIYKLKTGCQWRHIFVELEGVTYPFSWQLVYYYYRKWLKAGVFEHAFMAILNNRKIKLNTQIMYLDGTHSLSKKGAAESNIKDGKKGEHQTS